MQESLGTLSVKTRNSTQFSGLGLIDFCLFQKQKFSLVDRDWSGVKTLFLLNKGPLTETLALLHLTVYYDGCKSVS